MIPSSDIAFSPSVKAIQSARGSRDLYARMEAKGGFRSAIDARFIEALADANSAYMVTASASGQPYAQHRGGPRGFIRVVGDHTIGFADYSGNRQYITTGNLAENPQAFLFLMDYAHRRRIKIWGWARVVDDDPVLISWLMPEGSEAHPEAVILFEVVAWDTNCPQHIPQKFDADLVATALDDRDAEIARLRAELAALRSGQGDQG
jgi:predicted pyridoxine 5'-phosphate oxidase superfamily flavin-nucleotide-binding protein